MKKQKCTICKKTKGKRLCIIKGNTFICPRCCAETRGNFCSSCSYFVEAEKYSFEKHKKSGFKHFTAMIDPEVDKKIDYALACVEKGNIHKGECLIKIEMQKHPNLHIVQYGMGTVMAMTGDYAESIKYFDKAIEIFPYFTEAWFNKANSQKNLFDVGPALYSFQKVIEFGDPNDSFVKSAKDIVKGMEDSIYKDTGLSLESYIHAMAEFNKAFLEMQKRNYENAIVGFKSVANINPINAQTYGNLALCYAFQGKKQKALEYLDKSLSIDPKYQPAIDNKRVISLLKDGEKLPDDCVKTVEYYKEMAENKQDAQQSH